jgi:hypothetical protein
MLPRRKKKQTTVKGRERGERTKIDWVIEEIVSSVEIIFCWTVIN